ncbi:MAG: hypothetical protein J6M14_01590 [Campylobacter sp.]|nr:hypothetical protein [Campylobacter sp.]
MTKYIKKEVEVEVDIDFDDILDEFGDEIIEFIKDKIWLQKNKDRKFLKEIFAHNTQIIAMAINTLAEDGSESDFNELFYSLGDTAKEKLSELLTYYARVGNNRSF